MADLFHELQKTKKHDKKARGRKVSMDSIINDFYTNRLSKEDMIALAENETEVGNELKSFLMDVYSFKKIKAYGKYLNDNRLRHNQINLNKFLEENDEKEAVVEPVERHRVEKRRKGSDDEGSEEEGSDDEGSDDEGSEEESEE